MNQSKIKHSNNVKNDFKIESCRLQQNLLTTGSLYHNKDSGMFLVFILLNTDYRGTCPNEGDSHSIPFCCWNYMSFSSKSKPLFQLWAHCFNTCCVAGRIPLVCREEYLCKYWGHVIYRLSSHRDCFCSNYRHKTCWAGRGIWTCRNIWR